MSYGIIRVEKVKRAAVGSMQYHNDRIPGEHSNEDIDPTRTPDNKEYVEHGSYRAEVSDRIDRFRDGGRKVRKDAVVLVEGIATASPDFFEGKSRDEVIAYFDDVYEFVKSEAGADNLIHFTVHLDETTPHAHFGFTPIKDGTLSWKKFFDGKYALMSFQDRHWEQVGKKWGLARGEKAEDTGRTHKTTQQMKRDAAREVAELRDEAEAQRGAVELASADLERTTGEVVEAEQRLECLQQDIEELQPAAVTVGQSVRTLIEGRGDGSRERELAEEKSQLGSEIEELERQVAEAGGRIADAERAMPALREACERARGRFEMASQRVTEAIGKLREVPSIVSEWAQGIARKLGKPVYNPNSLDRMARQAREVSRGMDVGATRGSRSWER